MRNKIIIIAASALLAGTIIAGASLRKKKLKLFGIKYRHKNMLLKKLHMI